MPGLRLEPLRIKKRKPEPPNQFPTLNKSGDSRYSMDKTNLLMAAELYTDRFLEAEPEMADEWWTHLPSLAVNFHQAAEAAALRRPAETTPQELAEDAWRRFSGQ